MMTNCQRTSIYEVYMKPVRRKDREITHQESTGILDVAE